MISFQSAKNEQIITDAKRECRSNSNDVFNANLNAKTSEASKVIKTSLA